MQDMKSNKTELICHIFVIYCVFVIIHFNQYYWPQTENNEKFVPDIHSHLRPAQINFE